MIRAEKAPNRIGVEAVLRHFEREPFELDDLLGGVGRGEIDALYLFGGDPAGWITAEQAAGLSKVGLLAVQDLLRSPASDIAEAASAGISMIGRREIEKRGAAAAASPWLLSLAV